MYLPIPSYNDTKCENEGTIQHPESILATLCESLLIIAKPWFEFHLCENAMKNLSLNVH